MFEVIKHLHSYWAYLVLIVLIVATVNALIKYFGDKEFGAFDFRISLFTLIVSHLQLLIGIVMFLVSPYLKIIGDNGMGAVMKDPVLRNNVVEHPLTMLIAIVLITIGYSKHKKKLTSRPKFKLLSIFYTLALILVLVKIPWHLWFA